MSSEIRVNKINNRAGLGTVTYTDTGIIVSGVSTASNFKTGTSDLHSAGINVAYADVDDFVDVGNIIKLGNAGVVTATTFSTSNVDVTTDKIVVGTGVTIEANQVATGQATFTGIVTASAFKLSDGSNVGGVESDAQGNTVGGTGAGNALDGDTYSNTLFGQVAGYALNSGDGNTAVGRYALQNGTSASNNSLLGYSAGRALTTGTNNVLLGYEAGTSVTSGSNVVAIGYEAADSLTTAGNSVIIGSQAGQNITDASNNVIIGHTAGYLLTSSNGNTYIGRVAGYTSNPSGFGANTAVGDYSGYGMTSATFNAFFGQSSGYQVTSGSQNTILGRSSGNNITTGSNNIVIGYDTTASSATTSNEITLGNSSITKFRIPGINVTLKDNGGTPTNGHVLTVDSNGEAGFAATSEPTFYDTSNRSTSIGHNAGNSLTSNSYDNVLVGAYAGRYLTGGDGERNTLVGYLCGGNIGSYRYNTAMGWETLKSAQSDHNTAIGYNSSAQVTTGGFNASLGSSSAFSLTSGASNVALGVASLGGVTTGSNNIGIGRRSGYGSNGTGALTTGSNNILIGYQTLPSSATVSNEVTIGDANIDKLRVPGLGLEFAKDHTYGVVGGRKNWFDNGSFDCIGGRRANTSMDYGNHHAYGWVTDRFQSRNSVQWTRSTNVPTGKGFSYSTQTNGAGGRLVQAVELPDYGDMGVFAPGSYWCVSLWSTAGVNQSGQAFSYDLGTTKTDIPIVHPSSGGVYQSTGETASGTSTGTFTRYYMVFQMPNSIISTASSAYWTWAFTAAGYATGWQLERVPTATSKPTPYEHVHPSVTIARCRRYAYQCVNSRLVNGYKRHDSNIHWSVQFPVPPTHMPSGSNQSVSPYGIYLHDGGLLSNFQTVLQNPGVNSLSISEFDYRSGRFLIVGTTNWSSTHATIPAWESQEYEILHGHF